MVEPALPVAVPASNLEATAEAEEPAISGNAAIPSVWFKWTAPASSMVVVDLCKNGFTGPEFPFESVAVRTGAGRSCCGSMPARGKYEAVSPDRGAGSYIAWCGGWQL